MDISDNLHFEKTVCVHLIHYHQIISFLNILSFTFLSTHFLCWFLFFYKCGKVKIFLVLQLSLCVLLEKRKKSWRTTCIFYNHWIRLKQRALKNLLYLDILDSIVTKRRKNTGSDFMDSIQTVAILQCRKFLCFSCLELSPTSLTINVGMKQWRY